MSDESKPGRRDVMRAGLAGAAALGAGGEARAQMGKKASVAVDPRNPELEPKYRMPRWFGRAPGPRNMPEDKRQFASDRDYFMITVSAVSERAALQALLPPRCTVWGEPVVSVMCNYMTNLGWLAGRGYAMTQVSIPVEVKGKDRTLHGAFTAVLWENMADPIITGREELGFAKLYADIPDATVIGDRYAYHAAWDGFRFLDVEATGMSEAKAAALPSPPSSDGSFHYKFIPRTGAQGEADVEYLAMAPTAASPMTVSRRLAGEGSFAFHEARWEDMPTQYPVVNVLAALPLLRFLPATVTYSSERGGDAPGGLGAMVRVS